MNGNLRSIIKTSAILLVIGFVCTLLLSLCNFLTKDTIASLAFESEQKAMTETLAQAEKFEKFNYNADDVVSEVYEGTSGEKVVGYCFKAEPKGYGGAISMIVGVDTECKVTGVAIVNMSETPGLGAKAKESSFTDAYKGKTSGIKVNKSGAPKDNEISAISGATITSKAVTEGVNRALEIAEDLTKGGMDK